MVTVNRPHGRALILAVFLTAAFGVLMVYDASAVSTSMRTKFSASTYFFSRQLTWFAVGSIVMLLATRVRIQGLRKLILPVLILWIVIMILTLIPGIGIEAGHARRWLHIGPLSFQPGEPLRIIFVLYLAHFFAQRDMQMTDFKNTLLPVLLVTGSIGLLFAAQPKIGSALLIASLALALFYFAGVPRHQLAAVMGVCLVLFTAAVFRLDYIQTRMHAWLNPEQHLHGVAFQTTQSLIAIGSGGFMGVGLGQGRQKMMYLPEAHTDFIFPVISEELGLIGALTLLAVYCAILLLGLGIASHQSDPFQKLAAVGLTLCIVLPAFINLSVATGLMPVTGIPLPFISFGGSALVTDMTAAGLLAAVSGGAS